MDKPARFLGVFIIVFLLSGCGIIDWFYLPPGEDTAQELFEAGNDAMRDKNYVGASKYYSKLKDLFPFSPYAVEAELSLADCYFLDEEWPAAVDAYKEFESLHPRHQAIPYVLFNIGMASMNGYPSIDRPSDPIVEAYSYFQRLIESYPNTEYAAVSAEKMKECRKLMAEHELFYADFYYRMGRYASALARYKVIIDKYQDVTEIYEFAIEKSKAAFVLNTENEAEDTRKQREGSWRDWFKWL
ncbi:MAG: outer membrane protein assembly factor BamD [Desulfovibrio sp.]|jgi:outer membrane protein assembly factor BamD|nr:outer membrane protein assembly factor BamD [Desulfovibrio sp.]